MKSERSAQVVTGVERQTYSVWPDLANILGLGKNGAYKAVNRGEVRAIRVGRRILVPKAEVERLLGGAG